MTPKSAAEARYRAASMTLAAEHAFARRLVNSGRLSTPCPLTGLSLQTPGNMDDGVAPGAACLDAPLTEGGRPLFLLDRLGGDFALLAIGRSEEHTSELQSLMRNSYA